MQLRNRQIFSISLASLLLIAGWSVYGQKPSLKPKVTAWEYKTTAILNEQQLNELGAQGWELIVANTQGNSNLFIFKRQK